LIKFYVPNLKNFRSVYLNISAMDSKALDEDAWIFWKKKKPAHQNEI
jgi:hypothetical protein